MFYGTVDACWMCTCLLPDIAYSLNMLRIQEGEQYNQNFCFLLCNMSEGVICQKVLSQLNRVELIVYTISYSEPGYRAIYRAMPSCASALVPVF